MVNESLRQQCLALLLSSRENKKGLSTRVVAEYLDISVYRTRLLLLKLQEEGVVQTMPGRKLARGAVLYWGLR